MVVMRLLSRLQQSPAVFCLSVLRHNIQTQKGRCNRPIVLDTANVPHDGVVGHQPYVGMPPEWLIRPWALTVTLTDS